MTLSRSVTVVCSTNSLRELPKIAYFLLKSSNQQENCGYVHDSRLKPRYERSNFLGVGYHQKRDDAVDRQTTATGLGR